MRSDTDNCTWLTVAYSRKEQAKALGARWDALTKRWYCPHHLALYPFQQHGFTTGPQRKGATRAAIPHPDP